MKISINKEIANRVRAYRKKNGYSQEQISDIIGLTRVSYVNMEAGRQAIAAVYIYNLCRVFKCKPTALFPKITPVRLKLRKTKTLVYKTKKFYDKI